MTEGIKIKVGLDGVPQVQQGVQAVSRSLDTVGVSQARLRQQTFQAGQQLQDFFVQIQGGANPLTALVQQGSQLTAVYGGVGEALRGVASLITPTVIAVGAAAGTVGALTAAFIANRNEAAEFRRTIELTGNAAGLTADRFDDLQRRVSEGTRTTLGSTRDTLIQLAGSGRLAGSALEETAEAVQRLALATGQSSESIAQRFVGLVDNVAAGAANLNKQYNFLSIEQFKQIKLLEDQGKQQEAVALTLSLLNDRVGDQTANLGLAGRAWNSLKTAIDGAWEALKRFDPSRTPTTGEQLGAVQQGIDSLDAEISDRALAGDTRRVEVLQQQRAVLVEQQSILQSTQRETNKAADAAAAAAQRNQKAIADLLGAKSGAPNTAFADLIGQLNAIARSQAAETESGERASEARRLQIRLVDDFVKVTDKLTATQRVQIAAEIAARVEAQQTIDLRKQELAAAQDLANARVEARRREQAAIDESDRANRNEAAQSLRTVAQRIQALKDEEAASALAADGQTTLAEAIELVTIARLEERRARLDPNSTAARDLDIEIERRRELLELIRGKAGREATEQSLQDQARAYANTYGRISDSITDAIIQGGTSAKELLKRLFETLVLRPVLDPVVRAVTGGILGGGAAGSALAGTGGSAGLGSALDIVGTISRGFSSLTGSLQTQTLRLGDFLATSQSSSLNSVGGFLQNNSQAIGTAGSVLAAYGVGSGIGRSVSGGFSAAGSGSGNTAINIGAAIGTAVAGPLGTAVGAALGGVVNRLFGRRAPEVVGRTLEGTFTGADFTGATVTETLEKGGLFRSDRRRTSTDPITGDIDKALDEGARQIADVARKYGEAIGLPVKALDNVSTSIRVTLTDDLAANSKAIEDALVQFADDLVGTFAAELEPLRLSGETITQTIERLGGALLSVNEVLEGIGLAALDTSVAGAQAASALSELFGGAGNLASLASTFYQRFYSDAERAQRASVQVGEALAQVGLQAPATRDAYRSLVEAQDLTTESGREAFTVLLSLAGAFDEIQTASEAAADALRRQAAEQEAANARLQDAITAGASRFLDGDDLQAFQVRRIREQLAGAGVDVTVEQLQSATKEQIQAFVISVLSAGDASLEAQTAIVQAATALAALKDAAADSAAEVERAAQRQRDVDAGRARAITGRLDSIAPDFLSGSELETFRASRIVQILAEGGIETTVGQVLGATTDVIRDLFTQVGLDGQEAILEALPLWQALNESITATSRAVDAYRRGTLGESIEDARLAALSPTDRIARLRGTEAQLFQELQTSADPVGVAERLTQVTLRRIREEADLREDVNQATIDGLEEQLDSARALRDVARSLPQFTDELRLGSNSPLGSEQRLQVAEALFQSTLTRARGGDRTALSNLQGNAEAFIEQAIAAFGSGPQAGAIFDRVTGALDSLAAEVGGSIDPQISALEAQVDSLASIDETAAEQLAFLQSIDAALAGRGTGASGLTDARPGDDITEAVQAGGSTTEQIATATTQTADQTRQVVQQLQAVAANTARLEGVVLAVQGHAEIDREGLTQLIAQHRASVDALQQILSQLRFGTLAVAQP